MISCLGTSPTVVLLSTGDDPLPPTTCRPTQLDCRPPLARDLLVTALGNIFKYFLHFSISFLSLERRSFLIRAIQIRSRVLVILTLVSPLLLAISSASSSSPQLRANPDTVRVLQHIIRSATPRPINRCGYHPVGDALRGQSMWHHPIGDTTNQCVIQFLRPCRVRLF